MTKWGRELNSKYIVLQRYVTQILKSDKYQLINLKNEDKDFWLPEEDNKVSIGIKLVHQRCFVTCFVQLLVNVGTGGFPEILFHCPQ